MMKKKKTTVTKSVNRRLCKHHWVISPPQGKDSRGLCKLCGKKKVFSNSSESIMWEKTNTLRKTEINYSNNIPMPTTTDKNFEN
tara:strand:- start:576 stop:827 length:252 start_codon:yes stop_codon:yes gene_type:complete